MSINENNLSAWIRKQDQARAEMEQKIQELSGSKQFVSFKERTIRQALKATPNWYVWEINFAAGALQRTPVTIQTDPRGYFFAERIYMAFRVVDAGAGTTNGRWMPVSSDNPMIMSGNLAAGAVLFPANWPGLDFYWEYSEGSASLSRMNAAVSGAILYRGDLDGVIPGSDGWQPSTTVTFFITPTVAVIRAGVFHVACAGIQCYQSLM
jgi:hypothetical protein